MCNSTKPQSPESNTPCAPELRQDPVTGQSVVIAEGRAQRPHARTVAAERPSATSCPFCRGHEQETPPPVAVYPPPAQTPSSTGNSESCPISSRRWFRPIPLLPRSIRRPGLFQPAGDMKLSSSRPVTSSASPNFRVAQAALVLQAYRDRLAVFASDPSVVFGLAFKNCGQNAGMSLEHIHSQLIGLPFIPPVLLAELTGAQRFYSERRECVFCHCAAVETRQRARIIRETDHFLAICPFASRVPFEMWVLPRRHAAHFEDTPDDQFTELAELLQDLLRRLEVSLTHPAYNYVLHTSPFDTRSQDHYHWHFEIIPRIAHFAGLEWGTGVYVNIVSPESAARTLRQAGEV